MARHIAVHEPGRGTGTQSTYAVTTASAVGIAANARRYLLIQNNSDEDVFINLTGATVTVANGFKIAASGGSLELHTWVPSGAITAIHGGSGTKTLTYMEG